MTQPAATAPSTHERRLTMTDEEWFTWSAIGTEAEWVDGQAIICMPPSILHARIVLLLASLLGLYVRAPRLGGVLAAAVEMRLSPHVSREPDILFIAREHRDRLTPQRLEGPADLVVELVADDSVQRDRQLKFREYQAAGVPEYWLLDPRPGHQSSDFFRRTGEGIYEPIPLDADGRLHSLVLPDFWFHPAWLWSDPLPDPLDCLRAIVPDLLDRPRRLDR